MRTCRLCDEPVHPDYEHSSYLLHVIEKHWHLVLRIKAAFDDPKEEANLTADLEAGRIR